MWNRVARSLYFFITPEGIKTVLCLPFDDAPQLTHGVRRQSQIPQFLVTHSSDLCIENQKTYIKSIYFFFISHKYPRKIHLVYGIILQISLKAWQLLSQSFFQRFYRVCRPESRRRRSLFRSCLRILILCVTVSWI